MIFAKNTFLNLEPTKVHIKNVETLYMLSELNKKKIKKKIIPFYTTFTYKSELILKNSIYSHPKRDLSDFAEGKVRLAWKAS